MSGAPSTQWWIPERIIGDGDQARCRWVDIGETRYTAPFFESTVAGRNRGVAAERWSSLAELVDEAAAAPPLLPATFIFHVSRCGSTMLAQFFGLDEQTIVLSEVPILDAILRGQWSDRERLFGAVLRLLGRPRLGTEQRLVVKTDCWHLFDAATVRRLYADAPFLLLYRSAEAVLASHARMRGGHMVPGVRPGARAFDCSRSTLDQYAALVLEDYYRAMVELAETDTNCLLLRYEDGLTAEFIRATRWLGVAIDAAARERLDERSRFHAKRPEEQFDAAAPPVPGGIDFTSLHRLVGQLQQVQAARG